jgi:hypothetical protein
LLSSQLALAALLSLGTASVDRVRRSSSECRARDAWLKCHVAAFFIVLHEFFISCFVVVLDAFVAFVGEAALWLRG